MNKTININLGGFFFHIDEDAYNKLQRYLNAIRKSFTDSQGRDEIISDIESRIGELFSEKMQDDRQVVSMKEVDEVIAVMGQPEDYLVDDEVFDDRPKATRAKRSYKQLFRDTDAQYISGVSSGLGHYLGIDAIWIRLIWILLTIFSSGGFIFVYILLWILVPEAKTTADKLEMRGKAVNISNIEQKVKEGFDDVANKVKDADVTNKVKSGTRSFFGTIGDVFMFFFKIIAKFIGVLLLIVSAATIIGLFIGMFSLGIADMVHFPGIDFADLFNRTNVPIWFMSLLLFLAVAIPFAFLFILGMKILVKNAKSIGRPAKYTLLAVWTLSVVGLIFFGAREAAEYAVEGSSTDKRELYIAQTDTLSVKFIENEAYQDRLFNDSNLDIVYGEGGEDLVYSEEVYLNVRRTNDSIPSIKVEKEARGRSFGNAREHAEAIVYAYTSEGNELLLDDHFITGMSHKHRDQNVLVTLYLPEGYHLTLDKSADDHISHRIRNDQNYYRDNMVGYLWKVGEDNELLCADCKTEEEEDEEKDEEQQVESEENNTIEEEEEAPEEETPTIDTIETTVQ